MISIVAHVPAYEFPAGVVLFLGGLGVGLGIGVYWRYFRAR